MNEYEVEVRLYKLKDNGERPDEVELYKDNRTLMPLMSLWKMMQDITFEMDQSIMLEEGKELINDRNA